MFGQTVGDWLALAALVLALVAAGGLGWLLARVGRMERRYTALLGALPTTGAAGPEAVLGVLGRVRERLAVLETRADQVEQALPGCIQRVGLVRFNPFQDTGGDQSFAL